MLKKQILLIVLLMLSPVIVASTYQLSYSIEIENDENASSTCTITTENVNKVINCVGTKNTETLKLKNNKLIEWINYFSPKTYFNAKHVDNNIILTGKNKDKEIYKEYKLSNTPWVQSPSLLLTEFILSNKKEIEFVMATGPMFSKMIIKKETQETVTINNKTYESIKIKMSPPGLLGKLWKASIWYDAKNGNMIKYEAPNGPPGSKKLIMKIQET